MTVCVFSKSAGSYRFGVFYVETRRFAFEALIKNLPTPIECLGIKRRFNCHGQKIAFGSFVINFFYLHRSIHASTARTCAQLSILLADQLG